MPLSRRQFFRRFLSPSERSAQERLTRYAVLESYVRTHLLPYDFAVTDEQLSELVAEVRVILGSTSDEDLFSPRIYNVIDGIVNAKIEPWREAYWLQEGGRGNQV